MKELILVRHGDTVGQSSVRLYGATDIELSEHGREQMRRVGRALAGEAFDRLLSSPLRRSFEGARLVMNGRGPEPTVVEDFREIDFGQWEGWTFDEVAERDPDGLALYHKRQPDFGFPGGDLRQAFRDRVAGAARRVFGDPPARTLAVLHKGVIKVILGAIVEDLSPDEAMSRPVELGAYYRLRDDGAGWRVAEANVADHLGDVRIAESA